MSVNHCVFTDPRLGTTYTWPVNPPWDGVSPAQKLRQITRASNTANVGATKQQGDDGPYILHWQPVVFHAAHEQAMWHWFALSKLQTIYLTDWLLNVVEGQIISLSDQWTGASGGPGDTTARVGYSKMVMELEVWRFVSGLMADAGVTP